jgi:integrase
MITNEGDTTLDSAPCSFAKRLPFRGPFFVVGPPPRSQRGDRWRRLRVPGHEAEKAAFKRGDVENPGMYGPGGLTVHGFRSSFRDWAEEQTAFAEAALGHVVGDKVEAAYRRGDLFEKRRKLMAAWATFCMTPAEGEKVIPTGRGSRG